MYQDIIPTPYTSHPGFAKLKEGCVPIQYDACPDHQISATTVVFFLAVLRHLIDFLLSIEENTLRIVSRDLNCFPMFDMTLSVALNPVGIYTWNCHVSSLPEICNLICPPNADSYSFSLISSEFHRKLEKNT